MSDTYNSNGSGQSAMLMFAVGAAVGAALMLLYAPASGSETRSKLAQKATDLKEKAGEWGGQVADKATEWKDKAVAATHETMDKAADKLRGDSMGPGSGQPRQGVSSPT